MRLKNLWIAAALLIAMHLVSLAQEKRKIIIDEDGAGPGGTDQQAILLLVESPRTEVLGVTVVTGDSWLQEEVAHTLRTLEIVGRTDIPVVRGAELPLIRRKQETELWEKRYGAFTWLGAWTPGRYHPSQRLGEMPEGLPSTKAADEDAAHFLLRMVHKYPHEVTIYEGGPMTNLALAISLDPQFSELAKELIFMGGSLAPQTDDLEFANNPRHEFNFWLDPEAAYIALRAPWKKIVCTPVDISIKTRMTPAMVKQIEASGTPLARYVAQFFHPGDGGDYMWDELAAAAWIDPTLITKRETRYLSVDISHGAAYGNTLTWTDKDKPNFIVQPVEVQVDLDAEKFYPMFVNLMTASPAH